jgi:hypothetical protein
VGNEEREEFIFTFRSAHDAIMGERLLLDSGVDVRVMPLPRVLGKSCGIALRVSGEDTEKALSLLGENFLGLYKRSGRDAGEYIPWNP